MRRTAVVCPLILLILAGCSRPVTDAVPAIRDHVSEGISFACRAPQPANLKSFHRNPQIVNDAETAVRIAEPVFEAIYGKQDIYRERPIIAAQNGDDWLVKGTLPKGYVGGTPMAVISSKTGEIRCLTHGQ